MDSAELRTAIQQTAFDPTITPEPFAPLEKILDDAEEHLLLPAVILATEPAIKASGVDVAKYYLLTMANLRRGDIDHGYKVFGPLASKLESEAQWAALGSLGGRALDLAPRVEAALQVAKSVENAGLDSVDPAFLRRAYENFPDEPRLVLLTGEESARRAARDHDAKAMIEARQYWAEALLGFIGQKRYPQAEELFLKLADTREPAIVKSLVTALRKLGAQGQWARLWSALEIVLPAVRESGQVPDLWRHLLQLAPEGASGPNLRKYLAELAADAFPKVDGILDLLQKSGILDADAKIEAAMKQLEPLLAFAPGMHVLHASWGVGKIKMNDGESVILDFAGTPGHRMSLNLARRALQVVPHDDLRVLRAENPDELKRIAKSDAAGVAYLAIRQLGGQASTTDLKRVMLDGVLTTSGWTAWWKEAKSAMNDDDRFDLSQAFRAVYKIRDIGAADEGEVALPVVEPRRGIRPNLNLIRRFLEQHPDQTARAARTYTTILERWSKGEKTSAEERMAIYLQLFRWKPEVTPEFLDALTGMLESGVEASAFSDLTDQERLTKVALDRNDLWKEGVCFALSSRYAQIRGLALEKLAANAQTGRALLNELIGDPGRRPLAALTTIDLVVLRETKNEPYVPAAWDAALGAASLAEATSREPVRKLALGLLDIDGPLADVLLKTPLSEVQLDRIANLIRKWRSSERFLQPLIELVRKAGHEALVRSVRNERMAKTNQILGTTTELVDFSGHFVTRLTHLRLKKDLERLNLELRTTVAQAIATARALGDLRENAEYESAKQKQASHAERIASLTARLQQVRIIEDLSLPAGQIGPGTQVTVEVLETRERRTYWILGEGDDYHGPEVISFAAPMGHALLGKRAGEKVKVTLGDTSTEFSIETVVKRLPDPTPPASQSSESESTAGSV